MADSASSTPPNDRRRPAGERDLRALERLARESSSVKRRELMCRLSDFVEDDADDAEDAGETVELLGEILISLVEDLDEPERIELSHHIAPHETTPRKFAMRLAGDESVAVAEPVLARSPVLTDDDLVHIAETRSDGHLAAISRREQVSGRVSDAVIARASTDVLELIARNGNARITDQGFEKLISEAPNAPDLLATLSKRTDIPRQVVAEAVARMPVEYRERLNRIWAADTPSNETIVSETVRQMAEARLAQRRGMIEAKVAAKEVERGAATISDVVSKFAGANRPREVAHVIAARARLPEKFVNGALLRVNGNAISLICRSIDVSDTAFAEIARMLCVRLRLPDSQCHHLVQVYRSLDAAAARRTVRFSMARSAAHESDATED